MADALPAELVALLSAQDPVAKDAAWERFVSLHSRLLLHAARSLGKDYDGAMDRYAYALERLQERDFSRLRAYTPDGRTKFSTWLLVVFRRLCVDHYRQRYGRLSSQGGAEAASSGRSLRRQFANELLGRVDPDLLPAQDPPPLDGELASRHRAESLFAALSALAPTDRLLLKYRFEDGLSAREISRVMNFPTPFHVYRRLNALFLSLKHSLRSAGIDGPDG
jgi:RNA polymerase sigma factor (sigma-70 family)